MYTVKFDIPTLVLYVFVGLFAMLCVKKFNRSFVIINDGKSEKYNSTALRWMLVFLAVFSLFAAVRKVDVGIGGQDALNYIKWFKTSWDGADSFYEIEEKSEFLFQWYCQFIRLFTGNYKIFFLISYGFIAFSYMLFIKEYCPKDVSCIPFVLLVFPYLRGFCTLRTSMAVAVFLIGLVVIKKHKIIGCLLILSTVFVHRMSFVFIFIIPFYIVFKSKVVKAKGFKLTIISAVFIIASVVVAYYARSFIINNGLLSGTDLSYVSTMIGRSLLERWPMFFSQTLLLVALIVFSRRLKSTNQFNDVKIFCIFDFMLLPATIVLGLWRANEFLYLARLIMWACIIKSFDEMFDREKKMLIKFAILCVFIFWLIFRIHSEYNDLKIMPYVFDF